MDPKVILLVEGVAYTGWTQFTFEKSLNSLVSGANFVCTDGFLVKKLEDKIISGSSCQIFLGEDLILTGFITKSVTEMTPKSLLFKAQIHSNSIDLEQSMLDYKDSTEFEIKTFESAVQYICAQYSVPVTFESVASDGQVYYKPNIGDKPADVLKTLASRFGMIITSGPKGIIVTKTQKRRLRYALERITSLTVTRDSSQVFSEYTILGQMTQDSSDTPHNFRENLVSTLKVPGRVRKKILQATAGASLLNPQERLTMEKNRDYGQSLQVSCVVPGVNYSTEELWDTNFLVTLKHRRLPQLNIRDARPGLYEVLISGVSFSLSKDSLQTTLTCVDPIAYYSEDKLPWKTL